MNKIRLLFVTLCASFVLAAGGARGQTIVQTMIFSMLGQYSTNVPTAIGFDTYTPTILFTSANIVKTLAVQRFGTHWTNWGGASLVREINLDDPNNPIEGIFIKKGIDQFDVTTNFGSSYSNDFTGSLPTDFPGLSNFSGQNGYLPPTNVSRIITGEYRAAFGLHSLTLFSTNVQLNLIGTSSGTYTNVSGNIRGVHYQYRLLTEGITFNGVFTLNATTNIYNVGDNPPVFVGGPIRGALSFERANLIPDSDAIITQTNVGYISPVVPEVVETPVESGGDIEISSGASDTEITVQPLIPIERQSNGAVLQYQPIGAIATPLPPPLEQSALTNSDGDALTPP